MSQTLMLTGDVNLMNVTEPGVPFRRVAPLFRQADFVFSNLECCFYDPPGGHAVENDHGLGTGPATRSFPSTSLPVICTVNVTHSTNGA